MNDPHDQDTMPQYVSSTLDSNIAKSISKLGVFTSLTFCIIEGKPLYQGHMSNKNTCSKQRRLCIHACLSIYKKKTEFRKHIYKVKSMIKKKTWEEMNWYGN